MKVESDVLELRLEAFRQAVRRAGAKMTHQRLEIFREVAGRSDHPGVEDVFQSVRGRLPMISLDTVYRTLRLLNDLDVLTTLGPRRESQRFDANLEPHHHFVCQRCGLARDFTSPALDALPLPEAVAGMGIVFQAQVEVRGVCHACNTNSSPTE